MFMSAKKHIFLMFSKIVDILLKKKIKNIELAYEHKLLDVSFALDTSSTLWYTTALNKIKEQMRYEKFCLKYNF